MTPHHTVAQIPASLLRRLAVTCRPLLLSMALLILVSGGAAAQEGARLAVSDTLWEVRLAAGESYVGRVVAVSGDSVTLETTTGTRIQFTRDQAILVRPAVGNVRGSAFWREDPNDTRLFFSPTARTLPRGNGYVGVYELFVPFIAYGVTDRLLIAGGSPFYLALGEITPPFYFGPKVLVVSAPRFAASAGALAVVFPGGAETETSGIVYGVGTWGTRDHALSAGAGWGYIDNDLTERPLLMLGGETRVGRFTKLITENLFVPGENGVIASAGVRFFGERLSADTGLAGVFGSGRAWFVPVVNVVYNFGPDR